jgi:hypothetical protein
LYIKQQNVIQRSESLEVWIVLTVEITCKPRPPENLPVPSPDPSSIPHFQCLKRITLQGNNNLSPSCIFSSLCTSSNRILLPHATDASLVEIFLEPLRKNRRPLMNDLHMGSAHNGQRLVPSCAMLGPRKIYMPSIGVVNPGMGRDGGSG